MSIAVQVASASKATWLNHVQESIEFATEQELVLDLANIDRVSSEDLNELIRLQLLAKQSGKHLVLENLGESVQEVFALTRLDRLIELRSDPAHTPPMARHHLK